MYEIEPPGQKFASQGERVTCDSCGESFRVWSPEKVSDVHCFTCGSAVNVPEAMESTTTAEPEPAPAPEPAPEPEVTEPSTPEPFTYDGYTLFEREVELKGGNVQTIYFFSKKEPKSGSPTQKPTGYIVGVNDRTGLPYLKKGEESTDGTATTTPEPAPSPKETRSFGEVPVERVHGIGSEFGKDLRASGIDTVEAFRDTDSRKLAEMADVPLDRVRAWKRLGRLLDIYGIGDVYVAKLLAANVTNVNHLVKADAENLASRTGIAQSRITRWQTLGGLRDINGVDVEHAKGLFDLGITTLEDLANANPSDVAEVDGISVNQARSFIQAAKNKVSGHR